MWNAIIRRDNGNNGIMETTDKSSFPSISIGFQLAAAMAIASELGAHNRAN